jgi:RimJ/RimL family protein N-acetyltransferase
MRIAREGYEARRYRALMPTRGPAYRIVTPRLVVRCWDPVDAPLLKEAIDSSLDHLRPWMPWARHEPQTLAQKVDLLRRFRGNFDLGEEFVYGILDIEEAAVLGGTGLHSRVGDHGVEIGYWIRASRVGQGLATEAAAALTRVALELCEVDRVEIRVDPANAPSLAVPRKLGFREEATLRRRLPAGPDGVPRDVVVFALFRHELARTPCADVELEALDALGARILR